MSENIYKVYITYGFDCDTYQNGKSLGFGNTIHCNYIQEFNMSDPFSNNIDFYFNNIDYFKHLYDGVDKNTVFSINNVYGIVQIIDLGTDEVLQSDKWKKIDVTDQITDYGNNSVTPEQITDSIFSITYDMYSHSDYYSLDMLNYASIGETNNLALGDETFFFGNVVTDIEAIGHTMEIPIPLNIGEFNYTTNPTWDGSSELLISEVGIYDGDYNLVAIGKFNAPITKTESISRTVVFNMDF